MIVKTVVPVAILFTIIEIVSSSTHNLEPNDIPSIHRPFIEQENRLYRYLLDRFAPFTVTRPTTMDDSFSPLADIWRKEPRNKKMYTYYEVPAASEHYNKKDNSMYKDAFIGVRG